MKTSMKVRLPQESHALPYRAGKSHNVVRRGVAMFGQDTSASDSYVLRALAGRLSSVFAIGVSILIGSASAQAPEFEKRVDELRASLAASRATVRAYEWIETTVISVDGEEKARIINRCYYGVDGVLQKVPESAPPEDDTQRGLRGRIKEAKKEELTDYMKEALALVDAYVPPDAAKIQAVRDRGGMSVQPDEANRRVRFSFADYIKPGDTLAIEIDSVLPRPRSLVINTHLDSEKDPVVVNAAFDELPDGTSYVSGSVLSAAAKKLQIDVTNSGYRKMR